MTFTRSVSDYNVVAEFCIRMFSVLFYKAVSYISNIPPVVQCFCLIILIVWNLPLILLWTACVPNGKPEMHSNITKVGRTPCLHNCEIERREHPVSNKQQQLQCAVSEPNIQITTVMCVKTWRICLASDPMQTVITQVLTWPLDWLIINCWIDNFRSQSVPSDT